MPGDIVMNVGDPDLAALGNAGLRPDFEALTRLLAYLLFADTVFVPGRYLVGRPGAPSPMFDALRLAPVLLHEMVVVPDRQVVYVSFEDQARVNNLGTDALARGAALDEMVDPSAIRRYDAEPLQTQYCDRLIADLQPDGPLRSLFVRRSRRGDEYAERLLDIWVVERDWSRGRLVDHAKRSLPRGWHETVRRWLVARYYTVPGETDRVRMREIPGSALALLDEGGALTPARSGMDELGGPGLHGTPVDLFADAIRLELRTPEVDEAVAAEIAAIVLLVRAETTAARNLFAKIAHADRADAARSIAERLRAEWRKQQRSSRRLTHASLPVEVATSAMNQIAAGSISALARDAASYASAVSPRTARMIDALSGIAVDVAGDRHARRRMKRQTPWVYLHQELDSHLATLGG
jgi:hypothetical protein